MTHRQLLCLLALSLPGAASLSAQSPGDRIRVTVNQPTLHRISGTLTQLTSDSLVLARDSTNAAFSTGSVMKLEISRGTHRPIGRTAWKGALAGFVIGAALAAEDRCSDCVDSDGGGILAIGFTTAIGTLFGVAAGSVTVEDRWEAVK